MQKLKKTKATRTIAENILHLQRAIRRFGDPDGSRQAKLSELQRQAKP